MKSSQYLSTFSGFEQSADEGFLAAMNFLDHPIICLTTDYRIIQFNEYVMNFFRVSATDLSNENFKEFCERFALQDFPVFKRKNDILNGKVITNYITPLLIDDEKYYLQWSIARQLDKQKKAIGFVLTFKDVSVGKELRNLKNVMRSLPGHVYWKDADGVYLGCNEQQARDAGLTIEQMIGKTDADMVWKEDTERLRKVDLEVIKTGVPQLVEEYASQLANDQARIFLSHKVPLRGERGETIGVLGISFDITKRKKIEQKLKEAKNIIESEDKAKKNVLRKMVEQITGLTVKKDGTAEEYARMMADYYENLIAIMPGNVYWMNREGIYLGCNDNCAVHNGLSSRQETIGKTVYDLAGNKGDAELMEQNNQEVMNTGALRCVDEVDYNKFLLTHKVPLHDKDGKVIGLLGVSFDITDRKRMEKALAEEKERAERSDKLKTELLENMRHDMRTPLAGIIGFAELIKNVAKESKVTEYADNLIASGKALLHLLNGILETVKVAGGKIPFVQKKFSLKNQFENIMQLNQAQAKAKGLKFSLDYDENIPRYLMGDPFRVHRVILELVSNALKFTNSGFVKVSALLATKRGKKVVVKLIVQDTGIGISEDNRESIFIQFKKLKPSYKETHKEGYRGLGLGLSVVKQFIEDMDASIYVSSAENQGTTFTCVIPLKKPLLEDDDVGVSPVPVVELIPPFGAPVQKNIKRPVHRKEAQYRILVVEDDAFAAEVEESILSDLDNSVDVACDGKAALDLYKKNIYDLIFMDIGLPDTDGYQLTREMRLIEGDVECPVPIIALSAHADTGYRKRCIEAGMNAVLTKPLLREMADDVLNTFILGRRERMMEAGKLSPKPAAINKELLDVRGNIIDVNFMKRQLEYTDVAIKKFPPLLAKVLLNEDGPAFDEALKQKDWVIVQQIAHKIKGAATYGGALRLKEACHRLENYLNEGQRDLAANLSDLVSKEIQAVIDYVKDEYMK